MRKVATFTLLVVAGFFAAPVILSSVVDSSVAAAEEETSQKPQKTRRVPTMSERTYKKLAEVQEEVDAKNPKAAIQRLNEMLTLKGLNGNELGQIHNMFAYAYFTLEDYDKAIYHYEQVVAQGDNVPEGLEVGTIYSLAQLYFVTERYQKALDYMKLWLSKAENPGPDPHIFMGQVYYQMKDYRAAIPQIEKGIAIARERGTPPKENWWQLLRYLYYELENWDKVLEILELMVEEFPKREYWVQLAGIYGQEGREKDQVYAMESAHALGYLNRQSDVVTYAGLLMQEEVPYRAAKYLAKGIDDGIVEPTSKNLQMLGQAWQLAQEVDKAIPVFQDAGKKSDDGEIYSRLAQLYLEKDDYKGCVDAADGALRKGGLKKPQNTHIVRGMCLFNADRLTQARNAFTDACQVARSKKDNSSERICRQWITYIDREKNRREQLAAAAAS